MARREIEIGSSRGSRNYEAEVTHLEGRLRLLNQAAEKNEALLNIARDRAGSLSDAFKAASKTPAQ
jgi:hypothetical protein